MRVELVTIGDELLLGFTIDTNAAHLAKALSGIGVEIVRRTTVGDDATTIGAAVGDALGRTGAVITTGGLGPTSDDRSKHAVAALFGRDMQMDAEHLEWMRERWRKRWNRELPESNAQQALMPAGARKLVNNHGSAPGVWLEDAGGRWVAMLPGVPREMRGMLADALIPVLRGIAGDGAVVKSRTLRTTGVAESLLADQLDPLLPSLGELSLAYLPSPDGVDLRLTVRGRAAADADAALARGAQILLDRVRDHVYGEDDTDLAAVVLGLCRAGSLTVGLAESCTGGLLGARLTAIPGSSDVVVGGVIAYSDDMKRKLLHVSAELIREHGAVSEAVVVAMAAGARTVTGAGVGMAITGIAGPGGGTPEKPVGTVWIAVDVAGTVRTRLLQLWGDRDEIRRRSAQAALELLRQRLRS